MIESKKSLCTCIDHCRIGSLEKYMVVIQNDAHDHCRIGSLEILLPFSNFQSKDHCRIGSLENNYGELRVGVQ